MKRFKASFTIVGFLNEASMEITLAILNLDNFKNIEKNKAGTFQIFLLVISLIQAL